MIRSISLRHGGSYQFRIHSSKLNKLCNNGLSDLQRYLKDMQTTCPHKYFMEGPRSSVLKISVNSKLQHIPHDIQTLARIGLDSRYYDSAHMNVQMFMLGYDSKTIAIEVPIWLHPSELDNYTKLFNSDLPLTGHIDLVRIEDDGKIWIWDYKPNAHREKYADTQTYFYALMLSKRTGIPLDKFMCGYFDDKNTYIFNPSKIILK